MSTGVRDAEAGRAQGHDERGAMRRAMFLSQDGVVLCTTLRALDELEILAPSLSQERCLAELLPSLTEPGFGALRVALQCLASTGWLAEPPAMDAASAYLRWTAAGRGAMRHRDRYTALGRFLAGFGSGDEDAWTRPWEPAQTERFLALVGLACERWALGETEPEGIAALIRPHLDGALAVPVMLWLHETGGLGEDGPAPPAGEAGEAMGRLLSALGWTGSGASWTESGRVARDFALNFGGVATYLPLLARLPQLYRGELTAGPGADEADREWHVHRPLNLRISALAHRRYFKDADPIFLELFDREPLAEQPRFIADMGCGEGSWLVHLHGLVGERTLRGRHLGTHPLTMVGVDPDPGAREATRRNLEAAGAEAVLLSGDVGDPEGLRRGLAAHGLAIEDGLHVRAFIDHERTYAGDGGDLPAPGWASGAYVDARGAPVAGEAVERDLIAHLRRWAEAVPGHGMVVLEAHCVAPAIAARQLGALHGVAFDAHQAYSKQYPIDHPAWVRCCDEAGLQRLTHCERRYPGSRPFVSISLNRLLAADGPVFPAAGPAPREGGWEPDPGAGLEDGIALHEILFEGGDLRRLANWCSAPTGFVVAGALRAIEARLGTVREGEAIRILDYGAGTGTATIELLKACRERRLEERLRDRRATLELHLADLPSSWYAQGHALLRECAWTRFHSLRDADGAFRPLRRLLGDEPVDAVMASMVFHLIPPRALERVAAELAGLLPPGGPLLWSAPDLGPAGPWAVLLHDPNRSLRERWLEILSGGQPASSTAQDEALRRARELDPAEMRAAQERADRRIRPRPLAAEVTAALAPEFAGEVELAAYEMRSEEIVRGLLVPSKQAEYLPEIGDRKLREQVIRELMEDDVLPRLRQGPGGTALGLNLHWTLGAFSKRP